ncbi:unnamed protein product [Urochloa humidicola]
MSHLRCEPCGCGAGLSPPRSECHSTPPISCSPCRPPALNGTDDHAAFRAMEFNKLPVCGKSPLRGAIAEANGLFAGFTAGNDPEQA